jgi:hypothetical protein
MMKFPSSSLGGNFVVQGSYDGFADSDCGDSDSD